ncbi:hypothetical protein IscW_ISCW012983 [Ixodes scapularis]|uniref:Uncharacterized protein n=1 Tax=Ixodes scapularis TaxID=6945 RepID=B7QD75_IXOSC|nr:hypothetical protein IscW_ISCW012983 [Ixodes scapularis]|eukprot:XP_002413489.1 hypothetical protein IscW_ISCW012983 [Ixodes scapularis]
MDLTLAPLCLLLLAAAAEGSFGTTLTAVFNSGGIRGLVEFSPSPSGPVVNVRASLVGGQSKETFRWGVHRFPPRHDSSAPCDPIWTGDMFQDLTLRLGGLASEQEMRFLAPGLELFSGRDPLVGRALVLKSVQTGRSACATLLTSLSSRTYVAYFAGPVAGTVFVRQWASYASVYGELYWMNGTRRDYRVQWSLLHSGAARPSGRQVQQSLESTGVPVNVPIEKPDVLVPFYVPPGVAAQLWSPQAPTTRTYHVFSDLMSLEAVAMGNLQMALRDAAGTLISVVGLHLWRPKHAVANLGQNNGKVKPFETPPAGWGTSDQYAVGDLTGKYGLFSGKADVYRQLLDPTLPMSGPESVVGRMLVACGRNGVPLVCANILPVGRRLIRGRATFDGIVRGSVTVTQVEDDPLDDVYVDIGACWTGPNNSSVDHNWHVHSKALAPGSADCISTGGHYDPHKVAHNSVYECPTNVIGLPIVIHDAHYTGPRVACANIQRV